MGGGSSQFPRIEEGGGSGGDKLRDKLMFVMDVDLEADDAVGFGLGASRHSSRRLRFLPR